MKKYIICLCYGLIFTKVTFGQPLVNKNTVSVKPVVIKYEVITHNKHEKCIPCYRMKHMTKDWYKTYM